MIDVQPHSLQTFRFAVSDGWRERRPESPVTWLPKYVRFPEGWETTRFDFEDAPHVRGVLELFVMDETKRKCVLVWAVRLSKTTTLEGLAMWKAAEDPAPMAMLFPDNEQLDQIDDHVYPMFEACGPIAPQLAPPWDRNKKVIRLRNCRIRLASGGKKSSVSGYPAKWIFKVEHDKTNLRKSSEADPSLRIDSRSSGFARGVKIFEEGTPAKKSESRAAKAMENPDNQQAAFFVQCPVCKKYQTLEHDNLEWDKAAGGKSEPALAERTAWYRCKHKGCRIENHHRRAMMNTGKWVIEGQRINTHGKVTGRPKVESDTIVFGPLSKLYSLLIAGWGTIAGEMVRARHAFALGDEKPMEKLYTETYAIPWDPMRRKIPTNDLVDRLRMDDHPERGIIPDWACFLTFTNDVGMISDELVFYWMVTAWGNNCRGGIVDWGIWSGRQLFLSEWQATTYPLGDAAVPLWGQPSCIDSGKYTQEICDLCRPIKNCFPCKGDTNSKTIDLYWPGYQRVGLTARELQLKRKANAHDLLFINSQISQEWRVALTEGRLTADLPGFVSLPADVCDDWEDHEDFLAELVADVQVEGKWIGENNEFGDTLRYARALAQCYTGNGKRWGKLPLLSNAVHSGPRFFARSGRTTEGTGQKPFVDGFR